MDNNCIVRKLVLPKKVKAVTLPNPDGTFDVYINSLLTDEQQKKAFLHELSHIRKNHFYKDIPIVDCEEEAEKIASKVSNVLSAGR